MSQAKLVKDGGLAEQYRPKYLSEVVGQPVVTALTNAIEYDQVAGSYWVSGPPGIGKTSICLAFIKTIVCENRQEGQATACGECESCTHDIRSIPNIHYYDCSTANGLDDIGKTFEDLKKVSSYPPVNDIDSPSYRNYRIIFIDELQEAKERVRGLLNAVEQAPPTTIWLFSTMQPGKLDATVRDALESRCMPVVLYPLSEKDIAERLVTCLPELPLEAAHALSMFSDGNLRRAWKLLEFNWNMGSGNIDVDLIYDTQAGGACPAGRQAMWDALAQGNDSEVRQLIQGWLEKTTGDKLGPLLLKDLNNCIPPVGNRTRDKYLQLCMNLGRWASRPGSQGFCTDTLLPILLSYGTGVKVGIGSSSAVESEVTTAFPWNIRTLSELKSVCSTLLPSP